MVSDENSEARVSPVKVVIKYMYKCALKGRQNWLVELVAPKL
jgi:hypothetical protein